MKSVVFGMIAVDAMVVIPSVSMAQSRPMVQARARNGATVLVPKSRTYGECVTGSHNLGYKNPERIANFCRRLHP
jgi:hypothetical protein